LRYRRLWWTSFTKYIFVFATPADPTINTGSCLCRSRRQHMKKLAGIVACAGVLLTASHSALAQDKVVPGVRGIDHIGFTVPDIEQGVSFFRDVLGCQEAMRFGPFSDDEGTFMQDLVDVHPRAVIKQIAMM